MNQYENAVITAAQAVCDDADDAGCSGGIICVSTKLMESLADALYRQQQFAKEQNSDYSNIMRKKAQDDSRVNDGELEVDESAVVSKSDDGGAYVEAWLWVYDDKEEDDSCV